MGVGVNYLSGGRGRGDNRNPFSVDIPNFVETFQNAAKAEQDIQQGRFTNTMNSMKQRAIEGDTAASAAWDRAEPSRVSERIKSREAIIGFMGPRADWILSAGTPEEMQARYVEKLPEFKEFDDDGTPDPENVQEAMEQLKFLRAEYARQNKKIAGSGGTIYSYDPINGVNILQSGPDKNIVTGKDALNNPILINKADGTSTPVTTAGAPAGGSVMPPPAGGADTGGPMWTKPPVPGAAGAPAPSPQLAPSQQKQVNEVLKGVDTDTLKKINEASRNAEKRLGYLNQAEQSLQGVDTGPFAEAQATIAQLPMIGDYAGGKQYASQIQAAEAAIKPIGRTFRVAGEGSTSDSDAIAFSKSTASVSNQPEANTRIIKAQRAGSLREIDYGRTVQRLYSETGDMAAAQRAYAEYASANPIFNSENPEDGFNGKAMMSYDQWIAAGKPDNRPARMAMGKGKTGTVNPLTGTTYGKGYEKFPPPEKRRVGSLYMTPKGQAKWLGNGQWQIMNGGAGGR